MFPNLNYLLVLPTLNAAPTNWGLQAGVEVQDMISNQGLNHDKEQQ
jgi:hypothetical protein